jgi:integrase
MEIIKLKSGGISYKEKVYLADGTTITKSFRRKTDAILWKRQVEVKKTNEEILNLKGRKDSSEFETVFFDWIDRKIRPTRSLKTYAEYKSIGNKHLLPLYGALKVRGISKNHADTLVAKLVNLGLANKTINKILMVFKQVISFAEQEGLVLKNTLKGFPLLKVKPGRVDMLSQNEVLQLLRANAFLSIYPLIVTALNTGMRIGELTGLCWDRVNFETETIEVSRSLVRGILKETTKTNLIRYIPMNQEVKSVLWNLLKNQKCPRYVFTDEKGKPYNPDHFSGRHFRVALERSGVRIINFHILRHTYASHFMMNGGNIFDLQKLLGHTKVDMTMKYAHLSPQHLKNVVNTVRLSADGDKSISPFLAHREKSDSNLVMIKRY